MDENDEHPLIWVCRDIEGEHVGGPECFCCPVVFDPLDEAESLRIDEMVEAGLLGAGGLN